MKIFITQIAPILLYGSEVWGPYLNTDFTKWEKSEVEKTHTQFLKRILGCGIHTPNLMTRSEVGRRPMLTDIIKRNALFIQHAKLDPNSLVFTALEVESESRNEPDNIFNLVDKFTNPNSQNITNKYNLKKVINATYDDIWKTEINNLSKAESYTIHKTLSKFEVYLKVVKNNKHRRALSRFRLSCHQLMIEKGRHQKPPLERTLKEKSAQT